MKNIDRALTSGVLIVIGACLTNIPLWLIPNVIAYVGWALLLIGLAFMINLAIDALKSRDIA